MTSSSARPTFRTPGPDSITCTLERLERQRPRSWIRILSLRRDNEFLRRSRHDDEDEAGRASGSQVPRSIPSAGVLHGISSIEIVRHGVWKTSSIVAHHSPGCASGTRSWHGLVIAHQRCVTGSSAIFFMSARKVIPHVLKIRKEGVADEVDRIIPDVACADHPRTSGHTATCRRLYSSIISGRTRIVDP